MLASSLEINVLGSVSPSVVLCVLNCHLLRWTAHRITPPTCPHLLTPAGEGMLSFACLSVSLSPWRRSVIACVVAFSLLVLLIEPFLKPLWHLCCCCCWWWCFSFVHFVRVVSLCYRRIFGVKDPFKTVIEETTSKGSTQKCLEKWAKNHTTVVSRHRRSNRCTQRHGDTP